MNWIFLAVCTVGAAATIFVLHFLITVVRKWRHAVWLKQHGIEADARILTAEVINDESRYLPFVRLTAEVLDDKRTSFVTQIDSLLHTSQLAELVAGNIIRVVYNPTDYRDISLVKQATFNTQYQHWKPQFDTTQLSLAS